MCRFTLALEVALPDVEGREAIMRNHLARHCREHALGDAAVDQELMQVGLLSARPISMQCAHHLTHPFLGT